MENCALFHPLSFGVPYVVFNDFKVVKRSQDLSSAGRHKRTWLLIYHL